MVWLTNRRWYTIKYKDAFLKNFSSFFAHPFIITLLASGVLVYIGDTIKEHYNTKQNQYNYLTEVTNKKHATLARFSSAFDMEMHLLYNIKRKERWLVKASNKMDSIGRSRKELRSWLDKRWLEYEKVHESQALLFQIEALFKKPSIITGAQSLRKKISEFQRTDGDENAIEDQIGELYTGMGALTCEMGLEIRGEIRRLTENTEAQPLAADRGPWFFRFFRTFAPKRMDTQYGRAAG